MRFLHAANPKVIHGDLKAANILVDSRFRAKVADFGLSAKKKVGATGTPFWMAPELLLRRASNNTSTDVYSFGVIVSEVLSRREPYSEYENTDPKEVIRRITDPTINLRPTVPKGCPHQAVVLMEECMLVDPSQRPNFEEIGRLR